MNFIVNETEQKLRGGYYTPIDLANYVTSWVAQGEARSFLEPSCGDGVFVEALSRSGIRGASLTGFELFPEEAEKARSRLGKSSIKARIKCQDFLVWAITQIAAGERCFDGVVGNPPFIRYQYLPEEAQLRAEAIFKLLSLPFTKHTNAWVPFILASVALMKPGGRLGMIVPAEIIHVAHAQPLRTYLGSTCSRLLVIDPDEIWFEGTLQGAVILFAEKKRTSAPHGEGVGITRVRGKEFLRRDPNQLFNHSPRINGKTVEGKWTRALLDHSERDLVEELSVHKDVHRFDEIAKVDVGIVTGANKFFLVGDDIVRNFGLAKHAHPMFGRSEHCPGVIYDRRQHAMNARSGNPTNFIWLKGQLDQFNRRTAEYIELGRKQNLHSRYKCRVRSPWYTVPSVYATKIGMLKRAHDMPRLILNRFGAYTTDTAYRISALKHPPERVVYSFVNSLTALTCDLEGRHYGGGVLELVPSEIERLLIPLPRIRPELRKLDAFVRQSDTEEILEAQDCKVLGAIGLSRSEQAKIRDAWSRLRNRRQRVGGEDYDEQ